MLSGFQEIISLCHLEIFEQAEIFWRMFAWKCFPWRRRKCPPPLWWTEEGGLGPDRFWWQSWEEKWVVFISHLPLLPSLHLYPHQLYKRTENSSLLFWQMFILWAFFIQTLEIGNVGKNIEDVGWSRAPLHWWMDFESVVSWQQQKWKVTWKKWPREFSPQRISPLSWWPQTQRVWGWQLFWTTCDVTKGS